MSSLLPVGGGGSGSNGGSGSAATSSSTNSNDAALLQQQQQQQQRLRNVLMMKQQQQQPFHSSSSPQLQQQQTTNQLLNTTSGFVGPPLIHNTASMGSAATGRSSSHNNLMMTTSSRAVGSAAANNLSIRGRSNSSAAIQNALHVANNSPPRSQQQHRSILSMPQLRGTVNSSSSSHQLPLNSNINAYLQQQRQQQGGAAVTAAAASSMITAGKQQEQLAHSPASSTQPALVGTTAIEGSGGVETIHNHEGGVDVVSSGDHGDRTTTSQTQQQQHDTILQAMDQLSGGSNDADDLYTILLNSPGTTTTTSLGANNLGRATTTTTEAFEPSCTSSAAAEDALLFKNNQTPITSRLMYLQGNIKNKTTANTADDEQGHHQEKDENSIQFSDDGLIKTPGQDVIEKVMFQSPSNNLEQQQLPFAPTQVYNNSATAAATTNLPPVAAMATTTTSAATTTPSTAATETPSNRGEGTETAFASSPSSSSTTSSLPETGSGVVTTAEAASSQQATSSSPSSLLHHSCKLYPTTLAVVESALQLDPDSIRRAVSTSCSQTCASGMDDETTKGDKSGSKPTSAATRPIFQIGRRPSKRSRAESYSYPVNIALVNGCSKEVFELLASQAPDVLSLKDGPEKASTLAIALRHDCGKEFSKLILKHNAGAAKVLDRHSNTALHTYVVSCGASVNNDMLLALYRAWPEALKERNFHNQTVLDVAVRSGACPEETVDFLQRLSFGKLEAASYRKLEELNDDCDESEKGPSEVDVGNE